MADEKVASWALRLHGQTLFSDSNVSYASVRPRRHDDPASDWIIEVGVVDMARSRLPSRLALPGDSRALRGAGQPEQIDLVVVESGPIEGL